MTTLGELLVAGLASGGLSALAAHLGSRAKTPGGSLAITFVASLGTSIFCAPVTWVLLLAIGSGGVGGGDPWPEYLGTFLLVSFFGVFSAIPLGVGFGAINGAGVWAVKLARERPSLSTPDIAAVTLGVGWMVVGAGTFLAAAWTETAMPFPPLQLGWGVVASRLVLVPLALSSLGAVVVAVGGFRWLLRRAFVSRVRAGCVGWSIVPRAQVADAAGVPQLFPSSERHEVLVRVAEGEAGPFRSAGATDVIAYV